MKDELLHKLRMYTYAHEIGKLFSTQVRFRYLSAAFRYSF